MDSLRMACAEFPRSLVIAAMRGSRNEAYCILNDSVEVDSLKMDASRCDVASPRNVSLAWEGSMLAHEAL